MNKVDIEDHNKGQLINEVIELSSRIKEAPLKRAYAEFRARFVKI